MIEIHDHEADAEHDAGHEAAEKQITDRGIRDQRVKHHRNGRRDDRPDNGGGGRDGAGIGDRVATVLGHHADDNAADADGVGDRGAGHAGKDHIGDDVDVAQPAAKTADQDEAELKQPVGQAADVHQIGGEDEKRDRQQDVAVEQAVEDLLGRGAEIETRQQEIEDRGGDHGVPDRQAERAQEDDGENADGKGRRHLSP